MLIWLAGIVLLSGIGVGLQKRGVIQFSQFMLSTGLSLILLFSTIHSKLVNHELIHEGSYFNPRFFLIGLSFIPFVVFDLNKQRAILATSVSLNIAILLFYIPIHHLFNAAPEDIIGAPLKNNLFITIASTSAASAISIGMFLLKRANSNFEKQIAELLNTTAYQNDELNSGIRYAERLQRAVIQQTLPSRPGSVPCGFFQQAKDTLSGDFLFVEERGHQTYVSVIDCTGHGVPGAFVSLMGNSFLHNAMKSSISIPAPDQVLQKLQSQLQNSFSKAEDVKDGMDMAFVQVNREKKKLYYSSAYGIGFVVQNGTSTRLEAEKRSIGDGNSAPFATYSLDYEPGALLVLTSDGFKDQFGGPKGKKFGIRQFEKLAIEIANARPADRSRLIQSTFENWKQTEAQIDDVCVVAYPLD